MHPISNEHSMQLTISQCCPLPYCFLSKFKIRQLINIELTNLAAFIGEKSTDYIVK